MKLRNKRTGEIATLTLSTNGEDMIIMGNDMLAHITKLSELKDYEDYEEPKESKEPKEYWIIDTILHEIRFLPYKNNEEDKRYEQWLGELGLKFETKEEAEKAVEKLKAFKRLGDKGFRFLGYYRRLGETKSKGEIGFETYDYEGIKQDLDLLFSQEDD